jgi:hypothetical protein
VASVYDSERLAAAYAFDRPLVVHEQILRSARLARRADRAQDVGCGAGLSTAALAPLARRVIGLNRSRPCSPTGAASRRAPVSSSAGPSDCRWCRTTLEAVFADGPVTVVIPGHIATLARTAEPG